MKSVTITSISLHYMASTSKRYHFYKLKRFASVCLGVKQTINNHLINFLTSNIYLIFYGCKVFAKILSHLFLLKPRIFNQASVNFNFSSNFCLKRYQAQNGAVLSPTWANQDFTPNLTAASASPFLPNSANLSYVGPQISISFVCPMRPLIPCTLIHLTPFL